MIKKIKHSAMIIVILALYGTISWYVFKKPTLLSKKRICTSEIDKVAATQQEKLFGKICLMN